jgi:hypothetical protein
MSEGQKAKDRSRSFKTFRIEQEQKEGKDFRKFIIAVES